MSVLHPGSSINFDGAAVLQQNDEDEMQKEELQQRKELEELLTAELSDDLLEDDLSVNNSNPSLHFASPNPHPDISQSDFTPQVNSPSWVSQQHMTEVTQSSVPHQYYGDNIQKQMYQPYQENVASDYMAQQHFFYNVPYSQQQQQQPLDWQHYSVAYTNDNSNSYQRGNGVGQYVQYDDDQTHTSEQGFPFQEREVEGREDYEAVVDGHHQQNDIISSRDFVKFNQQPPRDNMRRSFPPASNTSPHKQNLFNTSDGSTLYHAQQNSVKDQEYNQLQILYKARGKKIDALTKEIETLKYDSAREKRMLNHQLAITKEQADSMTMKFDDCTKIVEEKENSVNNQEAKIRAMGIEIEGLQNGKAEMVKNLEVAERTIASLHEQIAQLNCSDTLERATSQHDKIISSMTLRFEQQQQELNVKLDECRHNLDEKTEEVDDLRSRLTKTLNESEQMLIDKTETINRLTKGLEDAQKQCQHLLGGEHFGMKQKYEDALASKIKTKEENSNLKKKVEDAERHLALYENALRLGSKFESKNQSGKAVLSHSYSELMGGRSSDVRKKLTWDTPKIPNLINVDSIPEDELVESLRSELERALTCNKNKRDEVSQLKSQLAEIEEECKHWRKRADEAQVELGMMSTSQLLGQGESRENLKLSLKDAEERSLQAEEEAKNLEEECNEIKAQMVEMMQEHDNNKREAVARCERACMQLNEDSKNKLRDELIAQHEQNVYEISLEYDHKIQDLNQEIAGLKSELTEVKQSYVRVCADKEDIEIHYKEEQNNKFIMEKDELIQEHRKILSELEQNLLRARLDEIKDLEAKHEKELEELKNSVEEEQAKDFAQQIETKIALAKISWVEEYTKSKQHAIEAALLEKEEEWKLKLENERLQWQENLASKVDEEISKERENWKKDQDALGTEEVEKIRKELLKEKENALRTANSMAELNMQVVKDKLEKELNRVRTNERESLMQEKTKAVEEAVADVTKSFELKIRTITEELEKTKASLIKEKDNMVKQKEEEFKEKIAGLQSEHNTDYENFVKDHKNQLSELLEKEKLKASESEKQDSKMFDEIKQIHKEEIQQIQLDYNNRCHQLQMEIERLLEEKEDLQRQLSEKNQLFTKEMLDEALQKHSKELSEKHINSLNTQKEFFDERYSTLQGEFELLNKECADLAEKLREITNEKNIEIDQARNENQHVLNELKTQNEHLKIEVEEKRKNEEQLIGKQKDDMSRLKERMRDEYKRWKKERSNLLEQIKRSCPNEGGKVIRAASDDSSVCSKCLNIEENRLRLLSTKDDASKKAFEELGDMYTKTLSAIKDEVMAFVSESRGRSRDTISRERKRTAEKVRSHYIQVIKNANPALLDKLPQSDEVLAQNSSPIDVSFLQDTPRSEADSDVLAGIQTPQDVGNKVEEWRKNSIHWKTKTPIPAGKSISTTQITSNHNNYPLLPSNQMNSASQNFTKQVPMSTAKSVPCFRTLQNPQHEEPIKIIKQNNYLQSNGNKENTYSNFPAQSSFIRNTGFQNG